LIGIDSYWAAKESGMQALERNAARPQEWQVSAVTIGGELFRLAAAGRADGTLGQIAIWWGERGSKGGGLMDAYAAAVSAGLEHGVPLADLLRPGLGMRFEPGGSTDDPEIPRARSAVDYFSRRLAIDWLPPGELSSRTC
jgi:hypothetical protein